MAAEMATVKKLDKKSSQESQRTLQWKRTALMSRTITAFKETISVDSDDDVDTKKQIKYGKPSQAAWAIFSEYCDNSTIHGMKYLGEKKRPWLERIFWIAVFSVSIYICAILVMNIWYKWHYNPVIVSFAEKSTPVWQIPFPAVTVCSETKSRQTVFNYTEMYWKIRDYAENNSQIYPTEEEIISYNVVAQVCEEHLIGHFKQASNFTSSENVTNILQQVMPTFKETYLKCLWRNLPNDCNDIFQTFITDDGICHTFNSLSPTDICHNEAVLSDLLYNIKRYSSDWNMEDGYGIKANISSYPHRVLGPGTKGGLDLLLNGYEMDFDDLCRGPVQGFKLLLHTPGEIPQMSKQYFRIPFDQEILIAIKPKIITTSSGLKHYEPNKRQCYFQKERLLRYFQVYTQNNCELECLANFTLNKCGCVKFSMPRNSSMPVCGAKKVSCLSEAAEELAMNEFNQGNRGTTKNYRTPTSCNCLPACTSIAYEAEISQADYDYKHFKSDNVLNHVIDYSKGSRKSRISIFFKEAQFLTSKRSELYGSTDFLANCGGLLGLFMGVSMLSLVEILYFCTLRLITNLQMRRKKRKEMQLKQKPKQNNQEKNA